jgi:DNA-binding MarR family transcriptional regulator
MEVEPPRVEDDDLDLVVQLRTAITRLSRRLRQESLGAISPAQASALAMVSRLGSPTLGELARAEQIQPPTMTRLIAGMEERGLVERASEPTDRRVVRITITPTGRHELERIRQTKTAFLARRLEGIPGSQRDQLPELVALLEAIEIDR